MIIRTNPVVANFDVLFFGKKGFSSLAKAKTIKFRPKGRKDLPWVVIDVSKKRKKLDKQRILFRHLEDARRETEKSQRKQRKSEEMAERKRIKSLHSTKDVQSKEKIRFKEVETKQTGQRVIRSKDGVDVLIQTHAFELNKLMNFVSGTKSPNSIQIEQFLLAVGEKFKEVFKKYKRTNYFLRITHRYRGLKPQKRGKVSKDGKRFDGFAIPRSRIDSAKDIDSAIMVLMENYLPKFDKYLKFATAHTSFDFLGFTLEVSLKDLK